MALVFSLDPGFPVRIGKRRACSGTVAFDNSYPTGGEAMLYSDFNFQSQLDEVMFVGGTHGFNIEFASGLAKVMAPAFNERILNPSEAARNLAAAAADVSTFHLARTTYCVGLFSVVTTAVVATTTPPAMSVEKRDANGTSNAVELGVITYADTDAVGVLDSYSTGAGAVGGGTTTSSRLVTPYLVPAGYTLVLKHKVQCVGGAIAGAAKVHIAVIDADANVELPNTYDLSALTAVRFIAIGW